MYEMVMFITNADNKIFLNVQIIRIRTELTGQDIKNKGRPQHFESVFLCFLYELRMR